MRFILLVFTFLSFVAVASPKKSVEETLNALHQYAAEAKYDAYFSLYSADAIFIGTDATETWTLPEFQAYTKPIFSKGKGWTYTPTERHIYFSPNGDVAWFDELLQNKSIGLTRGTGVLVLTESGWKISQYHLTMPVPNELIEDVAKQIMSQ